MGASESFDEFVKRQQSRKDVDAAFYLKQKQEWLQYLQQLYEQVARYLKSYTMDGSISIEIRPIELNEEGLGSYVAQRLTITIGPHDITLTPIGTMLIGSKGRVDVQGSRGKARLTLIDKTVSDARQLIKVNVRVVRPGQKLQTPKAGKAPSVIEWEWKIANGPPNTTFLDLTEDSFLAMIQEVSGE